MQPISTRSYANFLPQLRQTSYVQPDRVNGWLTLRCQQPKRNSRASNSVLAIVVYQQFVYPSCRAFGQTETAAPYVPRRTESVIGSAFGSLLTSLRCAAQCECAIGRWYR